MEMMPTNGHVETLPEVKEFRREGLDYVFEPRSTGVRFDAANLRPEHGDYKALITIRGFLPGYTGVLANGIWGLRGANTIASIKKQLKDNCDDKPPALPWNTLIQGFLLSVAQAEEAGEPYERVADLPDSTRLPDQVECLVNAQKTSCLYGPGGYGKGWLATGMAVAVAAGIPFAGLATRPGHVLYLDWEDDKDTFSERVKMICRGLGSGWPYSWRDLPIIYRRCERPLPADTRGIAAEVDREHVSLVIVDSVEMACQNGENLSLSDRTIIMQKALRVIHASHLLIDHESQGGVQGKGLAGKPINSIMKVNLCRNMWEIKKDQGVGEAISRVGLYHTKGNHTGVLPTMGFELDFRQPDAVRIARYNWQDSQELVEASGESGLALLIKKYLDRVGARPVDDIARELDAKPDTIYRQLTKGRGTRFVEVIPGVRGRTPGQWGVLA